MAESARAKAIQRVLARVDGTFQEVKYGFPHFADPQTGVWTTTPNGDWTGGFWPGILWLAALVTGSQRYRDAARAWSSKLRPRARSETVFRGFLFWYGAALGAVLFGDPVSREVALEGCFGLIQLYNPASRVIPLGAEAEEASDVGRTETNIDGVPGTVPLLMWGAGEADDARLEEFALAHAERHVELCVREDGSVCQSASFDPQTGNLLRRYTHKGIRDDSTWARAQAWGMLGFAQAGRWSPKCKDAAIRVSDWWIERLPSSRVAYWDFDDPAIPNAHLDTSATAIAAASLLKLAAMVPERAVRYRATAEAMVDALISHHLTPTSPEDRRPVGMLLDGCYNHRLGLATHHELIWGDYYLFESLCTLEGCLDPTRV